MAIHVDPPTNGDVWLTSSFCGTSTCVQAATIRGMVAIRDSKIQDSPVLEFSKDEFRAFVKGIKAGEFDTLYRAE